MKIRMVPGETKVGYPTGDDSDTSEGVFQTAHVVGGIDQNEVLGYYLKDGSETVFVHIEDVLWIESKRGARIERQTVEQAILNQRKAAAAEVSA